MRGQIRKGMGGSCRHRSRRRNVDIIDVRFLPNSVHGKNDKCRRKNEKCYHKEIGAEQAHAGGNDNRA